MANWIVGGALCVIVGLVIWRMIANKRAGKGTCSCGGDCGQCHGSCPHSK